MAIFSGSAAGCAIEGVPLVAVAGDGAGLPARDVGALDDRSPALDFPGHTLARLLGRAGIRLRADGVQLLLHVGRGECGHDLLVEPLHDGARGGAEGGLGPAPASPLNAPALTCGMAGGANSKATSMLSERSAVTSAGVPLNGTTCAWIPATDLNSSADRCCVEPTLMLPRFSLPGLFRATAMSSPRLASFEPEEATIPR